MLQFITHSNEKYDYLTSAIEALKGGCHWIQLRMKNIPEQTVIATALQLKEYCRKYNAKLILDDHVQATLKTGADGVHLGKNDMSPSDARKILGNGYIIGGTANPPRRRQFTRRPSPALPQRLRSSYGRSLV